MFSSFMIFAVINYAFIGIKEELKNFIPSLKEDIKGIKEDLKKQWSYLFPF